MPTVIAVDPSVRSAGIAVFDDRQLVAARALRPRGRTLSERLEDLRAQFLSICEAHRPDVVLIEQPPKAGFRRGRSGRTLNVWALIALGMSVGVFHATAIAVGATVHLIPVSLWKGRRKKVVDQLIALARYGIAQKDAADAIGIGEWWTTIGHRIFPLGERSAPLTPHTPRPFHPPSCSTQPLAECPPSRRR